MVTSSSSIATSSQSNSKVGKKSTSAELEDFLVGNIDPEQYMIVDISTQYIYVYKNKKSGSNVNTIFFF